MKSEVLERLFDGLAFCLAGHLFRHDSKRPLIGTGSPLHAALGIDNLSCQIGYDTLRGFGAGLHRTDAEYMEGFPGYWMGMAAKAERDLKILQREAFQKSWPEHKLQSINRAFKANRERTRQQAINLLYISKTTLSESQCQAQPQTT